MILLPALRIVRERAALSQRELADQSGVHRIQIIKLESGKHSARPTTVRKLAKALSVKPAELMEAANG